MSYMCPVCGYPKLTEPPYKKSSQPAIQGVPSHQICPSCRFEFGYTDMDKGFTFEKWRQDWIDGGMVWDNGRRPPPKSWNPREQVAKVMHITGGGW